MKISESPMYLNLGLMYPNLGFMHLNLGLMHSDLALVYPSLSSQDVSETVPRAPRRPPRRPTRASRRQTSAPRRFRWPQDEPRGLQNGPGSPKQASQESRERLTLFIFHCVLRCFLFVGVLWCMRFEERWRCTRNAPEWPEGQSRSAQEGPRRPPKPAQWAPGEVCERAWRRPEA